MAIIHDQRFRTQQQLAEDEDAAAEESCLEAAYETGIADGKRMAYEAMHIPQPRPQPRLRVVGGHGGR